MRRNPVLDALGSYQIADLQERALAMQAVDRSVIDFSIGDPREPTPEFIKDALRAAVPDVSQYPTVPGLPALRRTGADYVERRFGVTVDPDTQVLPSSGSKEVVFTSPLAFVDRALGDAVVYGTPGYPIYERGARFSGAEAIGIRLGGDFVLRAADVPEAVWDRARILWVCSPHNPTGSVTGLADLADLVDACRRHDVLLFADECYVDLYESDPPPSVLQVAGPDAEGVVSLLSLSKRSGMTGYRSGLVVGDREVIAALKELRVSIGVAPTEFVQAAAIAAWSDDEHVVERRAIFARKRAIMTRAFEELGYEVVGSEAGIYLWIRVGDDMGIAATLLDRGLVVSPGRAFGLGGEGYLRLALVPPVEDCERAVEVVQQCLAS